MLVVDRSVLCVNSISADELRARRRLAMRRLSELRSYGMVNVVESYRDFVPRCNAHTTVRELLASVPEEHLGGLRTIVLTNAAALTGKRRRSWSWSRSRKARHTDVAGLYHQEWRGEPAWIELFVDKIVEGVPTWALGLALVRSALFGAALYHELGHHIHARQRPEYREREDVADDWQKRLGQVHIRRRHPIARVALSPFISLARLVIRRPDRRAPR